MARFAANRILRLTAKVVMGLVAFVVLAPVLAFLGYDAVHFQSRWPEIVQLLDAATEEDRSPPEIVVRLIRADSQLGPALSASTILMHELNVRDPRTAAVHWHGVGALWWALTWLHLSEMQQMGLIASRQYMGHDAGPRQGIELRGYSAASHSLFQRPLSALSLSEAATIVVLPRRASFRWRNPEELGRWRDALVARLESNS